MRLIITIVFITFSFSVLAQQDCAGDCAGRSPAVVETSRELASIADVTDATNAQAAQEICDYLENGAVKLLKEVIDGLDIETKQFSRNVYEKASCGFKTILFTAADMSGRRNDLRFIKIVMGQLYKEGPGILREKLNAKSSMGISVVEYSKQRIGNSSDQRVQETWTEIYNFLASFS